MTKLKYVSKEVYQKRKKKLQKVKRFGALLLVGALAVGSAEHFLFPDGVSDFTSDYTAEHQNTEAVINDVMMDGNYEETPYVSPYTFTDDNVVGYLSSDALPQDYPVAIGEDNSFYLDHNINGDYDILGSIFMDYRNRKQGFDFEDQVTIIYGHNNTLSKTMFSSLTNYQDPDFYKEHPTFTYYTRDGAYEFEVFAGGEFNGNDVINDVNGYESEEAFLQDIEGVRVNSDFSSDVQVNGDDKVVVFFTCTNSGSSNSDMRYLLYAKVNPLTYVNDMGVVVEKENVDMSLSR